ncbi:MAG: hypothetical protein AAF432_04990 [Planctomycetota bacterium]
MNVVKATTAQVLSVERRRALIVGARIRASLVSFLLIMVCASSAHAQFVRAVTRNPIAPRGTSLAIPVVVDVNKPLPARIDLRLDDGRRLEGRLAVITAQPATSERRWTDNPRQLAIRAIRDGESFASTSSRFLLLAPLPMDAEGPIRLGSQTLEPLWVDPPPLPDGPPMPIEARPDRPDPISPFTYWRWVLLADRLRLAAPDTSHLDTIGGLWARHEAALWQWSLNRLGEEHPGVANACRDLLTHVSTDDDVAFAAWLAQPEQTTELLELMVDQERAINRIARDVLAWTDGVDPIFMWPEDDGPSVVRIAIVNPTPRATTARIRWASEREGVPLAIELQPLSMTSFEIRRPVQPGRGVVDTGPDPATQGEVLLVSVDGRERRVGFAPRRIEVAPPGVYIAPFRPPLTLAEVQDGRQRELASTHRTGMHLRRAYRRWELFIECERPFISRGDDRALEKVREPSRITGLETVTVDIETPALDGTDRVRRHVLTVPETGWHRVYDGGQDGTLRIHRRDQVSDARWSCRLVLPETWLSPTAGAPTRIRVVRTHADTSATESTSLPTAPWRDATSRWSFDLTTWADLPKQ